MSTRGTMSLSRLIDEISKSGVIDDASAAEHVEYGRRMQAEVDRARRRENLWRAGFRDALEPDFEAALIAGKFEPKSVSQKAMVRWVQQQRLRFLVLQGGTGCGKTGAAAYAVSEGGGYMRSAQQVVRAFASRALDAVDEQRRILAAPLLVLDDLGTEENRDRNWMTLALREVLELRQGLRTIITTNLTYRHVLAHYPNERIVSRLDPIVRTSWIVDAGPDLRKAKR